ncbi:lipopolysaccharide transport periplasmic protein LptA [Stenotrophomonas sp. CPCC 101365]|uniref:Lipopolysaccharide export system protein LptA n=2 Tax=Stenotrophomonas mori TaxID=2871096 RepID=A0ABT0SE80_9GAMM|nr:lipopolysaccharide transport periplasmic protein LptA [Stenotrophomonas mori]MCL7713315.1 lipopolysaccharide transport periplasmic protein LptA [Stenotrophomonas mori]
MPPARPAKFALPVLLAAALLPAPGMARESDRNQPMNVDADHSEGNLTGGNGRYRFSGNVVITQGTLEVHADTADVFQKNGETERVVFSGKQATLKQQMDDGSWMNARADNLDYNVNSEVIVLTGNYKVDSERGSNSGQRMVYNTRTGDLQSGGDGTRVRTVIQPKAKAPAAAGENR